MTNTRIRSFTVEGPVVDLWVTDCTCGVIFAMPVDLERRRRKDREGFYCPNGHRLVFTGKTDAQKLEEARARETALRDQLGAAVREAEHVRQALLRDRARFAAGVCPCCNRSFDNVRRHMATKHPDYDVTRVAVPHTTVSFRCSCGRSFDSLRGLRTHQGHARREGWDGPKASSWSAHLTKV